MKEEILRLLRSADGYISGQELCNRFGVSRTAVWKAINQLKEAGYEIEAQQNKGYRLMAAPDLMTEAEIKSLMHTEWVAKEVLYFDTIDSTNIKAQELAEKGYPSGTLVVADKGFVVQEKRRGRYSLSYKLFSIGSKVVEKTGLLKIARPYLERILTEIDETVNLAVPSGTEMLVIDKQVSSHALRQEVRLGSTFPMINSASGRIFLAFSEEEERKRLLSQIAAEGGETVQSKIELFRERFALIRSTGVEEDDEEQYEGIRCIAVPVLDGENVACGAVSVSIPTLRYRDELVHRAREIAVEQASLISRRMGAG